MLLHRLLSAGLAYRRYPRIKEILHKARKNLTYCTGYVCYIRCDARLFLLSNLVPKTINLELAWLACTCTERGVLCSSAKVSSNDDIHEGIALICSVALLSSCLSTIQA